MVKIPKKLIVITTLVIVGIILISIFAVTTQNEITNINKDIEEITDKPLSIKILSDSSSGTDPLTVNFEPLLLNEKGEVRYYWEFGDGNTSNEKNPSYKYEGEGIYTCKLTVEDSESKETAYYNVTVFPNHPPDVKIVVDRTTGFRPVKVNFDAQVFDPEGEDLEFLWELKHPPILAHEKIETFKTKNFSKLFIRNGMYVATLTVTDESGNSRTQYVRIQIQVSKIESNINGLIFFATTFKTTLWPLMESFAGPPLYKFLDSIWLKLPALFQKIIGAALDFFGIEYDPIIPIADLKITDIGEINHSISVNATGGVPIEASISKTIMIKNNDSSNIAKNVYLTLVNPLSNGEEGLADDLEKKELEVSIEVNGISKKLFYDGKYKQSEDCYLIDSLAPGDVFTGDITVTLKEAKDGTFKDNETYSCQLYVYQEKADYVDAIPFTIKT